MFVRGTDPLRLQKRGPIHQIMFEYGSEEEDFSHLPIVRARQMMGRSSSIAVHGDGVDLYYLPALAPLHVEKELD